MKALCFLSCLLLLVSPMAVADDVVPRDNVRQGVTVRAAPSAKGAEIGVLKPGERAPYLGSVPSWYRVKFGNGEGFVFKSTTSLVQSSVASVAIPSEFQIYAVDVGTGLAIVISAQDFLLVYDGGSNDDIGFKQANRLLSFLKLAYPDRTTIDHVILSHPHRDHVELLPDLFADYSVKNVWDSGAVNDICGYRKFIAAISNEPEAVYHSALHDTGKYPVNFEKPKKCYGESLPAGAIPIAHGPRITDAPISLGNSAHLRFLHADGSARHSFNENSLVAQVQLGQTKILLMGDAEAGGRASPTIMPKPGSVERILLDCCSADLKSDILVVGHHGSKTSSRAAFLDAVGAKQYVVSAGPTKYATVVLPDDDVIEQLEQRGSVFRTDLEDAECGENSAKVGRDADGKAGGCDNILMRLSSSGALDVSYWRMAESTEEQP